MLSSELMLLQQVFELADTKVHRTTSDICCCGSATRPRLHLFRQKLLQISLSTFTVKQSLKLWYAPKPHLALDPSWVVDNAPLDPVVSCAWDHYLPLPESHWHL